MNTDRFEIHLISTREKVQFIKNFATMHSGGVPVNDALRVLSEGAESKAFGRVLARMQKEVEQGSPLAAIFRKEEHVFGAVAVSLVSVGEVSGTLDESLQFLADYLEQSYDLNQEIGSAMIYPKFILTLTLTITVFLVSFILPKLIPLFTQLHVDLPLSTRLLLAIVSFFQTYLIAIIAATVVVLTTYLLLRKRPAVRLFLDRCWLRVPIFGGLIHDYQLALFCQLFVTLFRTGSPVNDALEVTANASTNSVYRGALLSVRGSVEQGTPLSRALGAHPRLFPLNMVIMVSAGEQSGTLEKAFSALAGSYTKEVNLKTKKLPSLIEPVLLVLIAFMVGFIALSIVMPIYGVTKGLTH